MRPSPKTFAGTDEFDLKLAADELAAGREMLRAAHQTGDREGIKVAIARLGLASRAIDLVVDRRGGRDVFAETPVAPLTTRKTS